MRPVVHTLLLFTSMLCLDALAATDDQTTEDAAAEPTNAAEEEAEPEAAEEPAAAPVTYTLTPRSDGSSLYVVVYNDPSGLASRFGHDHTISPSTFTGTVTWSDDDPSVCAIAIEFPVTALTVDPADLRDQADLDPGGAVNDSSKETIKNNFLGKNQLNSKEHPAVQYRSSKCERAGDAWNVTGTLSIRGSGKELTVPMTVKADGSTFAASGRFSASHADFGFKPFTNLAGALRNKPGLDFVVDVTGTAD